MIDERVPVIKCKYFEARTTSEHFSGVIWSFLSCPLTKDVHNHLRGDPLQLIALLYFSLSLREMLHFP